MIRDYSYFGCRPRYECEIYLRKKLVHKLSYLEGTEPCFRHIFRYFDNKRANFRGIYKLVCRKEFRHGSGNYCSLSKENIMKIIRYMRNSLHVHVNFKNTPDMYIFTFEIFGKPIKHKWVLTFSRVFFEWPYNEMAVDVFRIREAKSINGVDITHKSFLELYNLTISAYKHCIGQEQSLFKNLGVDLTGKELEEIFNSNLRYVQEVCCTNEYNELLELLNYDYSINFLKVDLDDTFKSRFELYSKNYEIIKQFKKDEKQKSVRRRTSKVIR